MKSKRQEKVLEIISKNDISTQEELIDALRKEGYNATQATASRDIRQLKLLKVMVDGTYKYIVTKNNYDDFAEYSNALFITSIKSVKYSMNNIIIRTSPGLAQAVAAALDSMNFSTILGCVAGDDTIIIVTNNEMESASLTNKIISMSTK